MPDFYRDAPGLRPPPTPATVHVLRPVTADADPYALRALQAEVEKVATAANGTRNHTLNAATFSLAQLVAGGALTEQTVRDELTNAAAACGLDPDETAKTIASGFRAGTQQPRGVPERTEVQIPAVTVLADPEHQRGERTSWYYRDIKPVLDGSQPELIPAVLLRSDDQALFYPGRVNGLLGESESGKTWVALLAVAQALHDHRPVLYLDFEDSAEGIISRLRALGVTDDELGWFRYIDPDEALGTTQQEDLGAALAEHTPDLIVTDGFNAAMTLLGLNLESNTDATTFAQKLLKPLANTGATVVYIDHVPKNKDNQGKGGIGAQAKRAMTTGCAIKVEVSQEFGKGMTGYLKLTVDKDRPGHVRAVSAGAKNAGTAVLSSDAVTGRVELRIDAPDMRPVDERGPFRPTALMQKISLFLVTVQGEGVGTNEILRNVSGKAEHIRQGLEMLVQEGYVSRKAGPRNSIVHKSVRPFLDNSLNLSMTESPSPDRVPTESRTHSSGPNATESRVPTPYRGDSVDSVAVTEDDRVDCVPDVRAKAAQIRGEHT